MSETPNQNEPVRDEDIESTGAGGAVNDGSPGLDGAEGGPRDTQDEGSKDGAEGGPLDTQDETDADGTDGGDADGTDA